MKSSIYSARIVVKGGKGGDGRVSFRSVPHQVKGGPDGGDGGKGGNVLLKTDDKYYSLEHLHREQIIKAIEGSSGGKNKKHGKNGKDRIIFLPIGTTVYTSGKKETIADLINEGEKITIVHGGRGGRGNIHFATATNQAPRIATPGGKGEEKEIELEFRPLIDVALIGPPNAGKSSLLARFTGSTPEVREYPFTTKKPHLWTCINDYKRYTFLDTPPLVAEFLPDIRLLIERARVVIVVLDGSKNDISNQFQPIKDEIISYFTGDLGKLYVIAVNKIDKRKGSVNKFVPYPMFILSIGDNSGIESLKSFVFNRLTEK
ncbi:50S ribosome-binding GTPase [candidate division WOR-3 bacterium]|nr:50S ribosome-binding GTPase [candidate division WOR-3 bacterium]